MSTDLLSWRTIQNSKKNRFNFSVANTLAHEMKKFQICYFLKVMEIDFYTEAIFLDKKGRADIFLPDRNLAIEVLETEEMESFVTKKIKYPCAVVSVDTWDGINFESVEKLVN